MNCQEERGLGVQGQDASLDIIYEDADVAVVNKPGYGGPSHSIVTSGTLVNALMYHVRTFRLSMVWFVRDCPPYRQDTSGLPYDC